MGSSKFKLKDDKKRVGKHKFKTLTSLGSCLSSDDMIVEAHEEEEEVKHQMSVASQNTGLPKLGAEFKKHGKEAMEFLILKTRFQDH